MLAVCGSCRADLGLSKGHGLALILDVGMAGNFHAIKEQVLKHDHTVSSQSIGVECVLQFFGTAGRPRGKLFLCRDLLAVDFQRFAGLPVHERTRQLVSLASSQAAVENGVHDGDLTHGLDFFLAVSGGRCA